jgi:hypothetical protein
VSDTDTSGSELDEDTRYLIASLDRELTDVRRFGERSTRQIHKLMLRDLREAQQRAREAERRARRAERRADAFERRIDEMRSSSTWKAGRIVVAVPTRIKSWRKS